MAQVVVTYKTREDAAAFDKYYFETHVPLAKKIPGLQKFEVSDGPVKTPAGPSDIHLIATLHFADEAAMRQGMSSEEANATMADAQTFMAAADSMILYSNREV